MEEEREQSDPAQEKFVQEYMALTHALQTGVLFENKSGLDTNAMSPKHLRVGVNLRAIEVAALVECLVEAGVITLERYNEAQIKWLKKEVADYEQRLSAHYGKSVTLG